MFSPSFPSRNITQQFRLQNILPFLVFLTRLKGFVVFPSYRFIALPTCYVPHDVSPGGHIPLRSFACGDVDDGAEQVGLAVLAPKILRQAVSCAPGVKRTQGRAFEGGG